MTLRARVVGAALPLGTRLVLRLRHRGLQARVMRHFYEMVYDAWNDRRWELNMAGLHPRRYTFECGGEQLPGLQQVYHGREGYFEAQQDFLEVFGEIELRVESLRVLGPRHVAVTTRFRGTSSGGGVPVDIPLTELHEFAEGFVVRQTYWWDRDAGLAEIMRRHGARTAVRA